MCVRVEGRDRHEPEIFVVPPPRRHFRNVKITIHHGDCGRLPAAATLRIGKALDFDAAQVADSTPLGRQLHRFTST